MSLTSHYIPKYIKTNQSFHKKIGIISPKNNDKFYRSSTNSFTYNLFSSLDYSRNIKHKKINSLSIFNQKQKPIKKFILTLSKFDNLPNKEVFINTFKNQVSPKFNHPNFTISNDIRNIYINNIMASCCNIVKLDPPKKKKIKKKLPYIDEKKKFKLKNNYLSKIFKNKMIKKNFDSSSNKKFNFDDHCYNKCNELFFIEDDNNINKKSFKRIIIKKNEKENIGKKADLVCKNNNVIYSIKNTINEFE